MTTIQFSSLLSYGSRCKNPGHKSSRPRNFFIVYWFFSNKPSREDGLRVSLRIHEITAPITFRTQNVKTLLSTCKYNTTVIPSPLLLKMTKRGVTLDNYRKFLSPDTLSVISMLIRWTSEECSKVSVIGGRPVLECSATHRGRCLSSYVRIGQKSAKSQSEITKYMRSNA
jgi:hypothetical protein